MARPPGARYSTLEVFLYQGSIVPSLGRRGHLLHGGLGNGSQHGLYSAALDPMSFGTAIGSRLEAAQSWRTSL